MDGENPVETTWNFYEKKDFLPPLKYSNGKNQLDIVNEIINGFVDKDWILLDGICGTGKSPIALHCCANFGKSIIVVPTKHLQDQYFRDYSKRMKVFNMKIEFLKGSNNFKCKYEGNKVDCDYPTLPCKVRLKSNESRHDVCKCPFWSPLYPPETAQKIKEEKEKIGIENISLKGYTSAAGLKCHVVRAPTCNYYKQYFSFWDDTDVIIMNDKIWEFMLMKKPATKLEVIDEYDNYFDSLYFDEMLSFSRIKRFYPKEDDVSKEGDALMDMYNKKMEFAYRINSLVSNADDKGVWSLLNELKDFFNTLLKDHEDLSISNFVDKLEICTSNKPECDIDYEIKKILGKDESIIHIIMPYPSIVLQKLFKNSQKVLLMSATPHSEKVLSDFFRIDPKIVKGEAIQPGTLFLMKTKMVYVNYRNWNNPGFRNEYYDIYRNIIRSIPKNEQTLIQSHSLKYSGLIAKEFEIPVDSSQADYYGNKGVFNEWLRGDFNILISTKCKRGVDLKDDLCRNIVIDKMPFPDKSDRKFKSIEKRFPLIFNEIYNDIAKRNLIQMIARGLRHKDDWVRVYTPDNVVYDTLKKINIFKIEEVKT